MTPVARVVVAAVVLGAAGLGFLWWRQHRELAIAPSAAPAAPTAPAARPPPTPLAPAGPPPIRHPLPNGPSPSRESDPSQADAYLRNALVELLGNRSVQSFLVTDDFARRLVATVNNLATGESAVDSWPVRPAGGRFNTASAAGEAVIAPGNSARYAAFVNFVEGADTQRAVALYQRLYPILQRAYEDLGFSGRYFNDRVVEVIDNLLATPATPQPIKVKKVQVSGAGTEGTTGGLYVFADPALEAASTGQKILLRMGPENAAKLKVKLTEIRLRIASAAP